MTPTIPLRFRESSFRRYEPVLLRFKDTYPEPIFFRSGNFALETTVCRIRDCVVAIRKPINIHWHPDLAYWLQDHWDGVTVTYDETGLIRIGKKLPRGAPVLDAHIVGEVEVKTASVKLIAQNPDDKVLAALCLLIDKHVIRDPVLITELTEPTKSIREEFLTTHHPNISLYPSPDNTPNTYLLL